MFIIMLHIEKKKINNVANYFGPMKISTKKTKPF